MAEWSKAPDSSVSLPEYRHIEPSGPRMWAWVRIPLLTETFEVKSSNGMLWHVRGNDHEPSLRLKVGFYQQCMIMIAGAGLKIHPSFVVNYDSRPCR